MAFGTRFGSLIRNSELRQLEYNSKSYARIQKSLEIIDSYQGNFIPVDKLRSVLASGRSQLGQELFALLCADFKSNRFYCEFGASDGESNSNTYVLEKNFGWNGIVAEPNPDYHLALTSNRQCQIEKRAVWIEDNAEVEIIQARELSTILGYQTSDQHAKNRRKFRRNVVWVPTITLDSMLRQWRAPREIDFLSIDTEGSELDLLKVFDFSSYQFGAICVEHNYRPSLQKLISLLSEHGYIQVLEQVSDFDAWFVPRNRSHLFRNSS